MPTLDFGYGGNISSENATTAESVNQESSTNLSTGEVSQDDESVSLNEVNTSTDTTTTTSEKTTTENNENNENNDVADNISLESGTTIELGDQTYTVDENGNLLDTNGNIFVEAKDVNEWMKNYNAVDTSSEINLNSIRAALDVDITDENGQSIEYDDSIEGIKSYINDVIASAKEDDYNTAYNTLFTKYPFVKDIIDYYVANGNSLNGWGQQPDRSNIVVDDNNQAQQEAIIRAAWQEQNRKGDIDGYINYLKSAGTLAATAKEELQGLQEIDKQNRENIERRAAQRAQEQQQMLENYWNNVYNIIQSKNIAGYQIPDNIIVERSGKKFAATPDDFFDYLYRVDEKGISAYQYELANEDAQQRTNDEILRAYLKFTGGNYSNLVDMAINKQQVEKLKLVAKQRSNQTIRINRPTKTNKSADIDLGYN